MTGYVLSEHTRQLTLPGSFALSSGQSLPGITVAYRTWGKLNANADNAVILCHALTGSADADDWWAPLFGVNKALDPSKDFIVCANALGSCYGSTGPTSSAPDGERWAARFPAISIRDQVNAQIALADALGIRGIRFVLGGSMGGLQALEWALLDRQRVRALVTIAASAAHSPWCIAWSETQRLAIAADPLFCDGRYDPAKPPTAGLGTARAIAMTTYRSAASFEQRFARDSARAVFGESISPSTDYAARAWVRHHAQSFIRRFDANCYLSLIGAMDSHDVGEGRGGLQAALASLDIPALVVSIPTDGLYVPNDQYALVEALPNASLAVLDSVHGHDGFLIDGTKLEPLISEFRERYRQCAATSLSAVRCA